MSDPNGRGARTRILLVGETWVVHSTHVKGFDSFTTSEFGNGGEYLLTALTESGFSAEQLPAHLVGDKFPSTRGELDQWDVIILSDIGANSFQLPNAVFKDGESRPDRLELLREWVHAGGALVMCGGYMSFSGIEAKARYGHSALRDVLPVRISNCDDRVERPGGLAPAVVEPDHPVVAGLEQHWPDILGYNELIADSKAKTLVTVGADPFVVVGEPGLGRTLIWAGDIGPHWAPEAMVTSDTYRQFWEQAVLWLTKQR